MTVWLSVVASERGAPGRGAGAAPAVPAPAKGTSMPPIRAAEVARSRALRPGRADLAQPGTEEGEEVMQLIYRLIRGDRCVQGGRETAVAVTRPGWAGW
ncbi:hypothetical protein GCM10010253_41700 [Streptomyces badius]|uniref:Uncharacterized protein n=1 Tax=Streptomyces badius TaxID=1941 RepID=A0ABQ2TBP2_STRBA|nr:hypothetical protein GCM10010253_41700 [Streptomyces badius]